MKKILLLICLILFFNKNFSENTSSNLLKYCRVQILTNITKFILALSENKTLKALFSYIDISTKSQKSEQLVIITHKNNKKYVQFVSLDDLRQLKEKYIFDEESYEIENELYEKIKKNSTPLQFEQLNGDCKISLPDNTFFNFKTSYSIEAQFLYYNNYEQIMNEMFQTDI